jgi:hypothetical protein
MAYERKQIMLSPEAMKAIQDRAASEKGYGSFADRYGVGSGVEAVDPTTGKKGMYFESAQRGDDTEGRAARMLGMQNSAAYGRLAGGERGVFGGKEELSRKAELDSVFGESRFGPGTGLYSESAARRMTADQESAKEKELAEMGAWSPADVATEVARSEVQKDAETLRKAVQVTTPNKMYTGEDIVGDAISSARSLRNTKANIDLGRGAPPSATATPQEGTLFKYRESEPIIARSRKSDQWDPNNPGGRPYGYPKAQRLPPNAGFNEPIDRGPGPESTKQMLAKLATQTGGSPYALQNRLSDRMGSYTPLPSMSKARQKSIMESELDLTNRAIKSLTRGRQSDSRSATAQKLFESRAGLNQALMKMRPADQNTAATRKKPRPGFKADGTRIGIGEALKRDLLGVQPR